MTVVMVLLAVVSVIRSALYLYTWRYDQSIFRSNKPYSFFGKDSWVRKYKYRNKFHLKQYGEVPIDDWQIELAQVTKRVRYHKFFALKYQEKFFGSGTFLVFVTDFFHFTQFLYLTLIVIAVVVAAGWPWWMILILKSIMSSTFQMFFGKFFKTKN